MKTIKQIFIFFIVVLLIDCKKEDSNYLADYAFKAELSFSGDFNGTLTFTCPKTSQKYPNSDGIVWSLNNYTIIARDKDGKALVIQLNNLTPGKIHCDMTTFNTNRIVIDKSNNLSGSNIHSYYADNGVCFADVTITSGGSASGDKIAGNITGTLMDTNGYTTWKITSGHFEGILTSGKVQK
jgi:hypothetical protein